jgi:cyclophilin family peptidyl-prolyl cis-trans isomerase
MKKLTILSMITAIVIAGCNATQNPPSTNTDKPAQTGQNSVPTSEDRVFAKMDPKQRNNIGSTEPTYFIKADKKYVATIKTSKGEIKVELDQASAPRTVNNFVYLSKYGYYDGLTFHRVEKNFVIQGGDPLGTGGGGPGYVLPAEIKLAHIDGAIAMARLPDSINPQRNSSGSQFYITLGAQSALDSGYSVFGKTIGGLDIVKKIEVGDKIERIDISE